MKRKMVISGVLAVVLVVAGLAAFTLISKPVPVKYQTLTSDEKGVVIDVTPLSVGTKEPMKFDFVLTTHQGSLDFDMTRNTVIVDSNGNVYTPTEWEGSPPGGHHRSGTLAFQPLKAKASGVKLLVKDVGVPERFFEWVLR
ncbi:hypothetical protein HYU11_04060 [Candidatus Woesearchaeota archaeon]|nr:hypothetical protein [Candidatus Woesearchaeota archaeon]